MPIGGFEGPSGRRVRSVERALTASALLPTAAFAALSALTVLLVVQMGISPLGVVGVPSARDGGHGVTMPRMSISIGPQRLPHSAPARERETTTTDSPTTLNLPGPAGHTIAPRRDREPTTAGFPASPTRLTHLTTLILARPVAHTIAPTPDRETTTAAAQSAAMTAAMTAALTDAAGTNATVTNAPVTTIWEVTTAAVEPQVEAGSGATAAPELMYTLLGRAATAPTLEPDAGNPQPPQNADTSVTSVKTPENTEATQASEHAKAAKSGP